MADSMIFALVLIGFQGVVLMLEVIFYLVNARWYYLVGPVVSRRRWQASEPGDRAIAGVEIALTAAKLAWRRYGHAFAVRRPWWEGSTYPRILVTVETGGAGGAAIVVEIKPLVTGALLLIPVAALVGGTTNSLWWVSVSVAVMVAGMYVYLFAWELKRLRALDVMRGELRAIGVRACGACGYDLFGLSGGTTCPECGTERGV